MPGVQTGTTPTWLSKTEDKHRIMSQGDTLLLISQIIHITWKTCASDNLYVKQYVQ